MGTDSQGAIMHWHFICLKQLVFLTYLLKFHVGQWSNSDALLNKNK